MKQVSKIKYKKSKVRVIKKRLEDMISWSDRLGSDEIFEIRSIIEDIDKEIIKQNESSKK